MRRLLVQTSVIQSLGMVLMLMTTLLVSRFAGPSTQGSLALVKSFNDLQVAVFSLGLPSAIVIMLNRTGRGHRSVLRLVWKYGLALLLLLPPINLALLALTGSSPEDGTIYLQAVLIGWSSAAFTAFAFLRALLLVRTDGPIFSVISILHWVIIFSTAVLLLNSTDLIFEIAYFVAGAGSLAIIYPMVRPRPAAACSLKEGDPIDWPLLRSQSGNVMLQTVLYGFQPFLTNAVLARVDQTLSLAGLFNIAALVITLPNLLVALVAPVLLNRWSKYLDWVGYASVQRHALALGAIGQVVALAVIPFLPVLITLVFGASFAAAVAPTQVMMLAVFAVIAGRILTPALQGMARNDVVSWSCAARVAAILAGAGATYFVAAQPMLLAMAAGWCIGENVALAFLLLSALRARRSAAGT